VDKDSDRSTKMASKKKKKDDKSRCGHSRDNKSRSTKHRSQSCGCSKSTDRWVKPNANTARRIDLMQASMTWINASTTKSTKDGDPEKYARNWESRSNADTNSLRT
jgi:hypothetical protein